MGLKMTKITESRFLPLVDPQCIHCWELITEDHNREDCSVTEMLATTATRIDKLPTSEFEPLAWCAICLHPGMSQHPHKENNDI
jgi:hypothetical protein